SQGSDVVDVFFKILVDQRLTDHRLPEVGVFILSFSVDFKGEVTIALHIFIFDTANHMHKVTQSKALVCLFRSKKNSLHIVCSIETFAWMHAVIAHSAVILRVFFTEVVKELTSAAYR